MSSHFIAGQWIDGEGAALRSADPATGQGVWEGRAATAAEVDRAVMAARAAAESWAGLSLEDRAAVLMKFKDRLTARKDDLSLMISREVGKPRWDAAAEAAAMINKVTISIDAYKARCQSKPVEVDAGTGQTRYKPHGVVAVLGPFNFPGHLPNGHIVPALIAGNTVVFKPSEMTPGVAQLTLEIWAEAGLPAGVLNLVQGGRDTGAALVNHPQVGGVFFTGSVAGGLALRRALVDKPQKILALEMGGNNPLIVHEAADLPAAAHITIQSAFLTSGQRCTCARRLIVPEGGQGDAFVQNLADMMTTIKIGPYTEQPEPFMGPVISVKAAESLMAAQEDLLGRGGVAIVQMQRPREGGAFVTPALIDVTAAANRPDAEIFGPLLQLIRVRDFDAAIAEANNTEYGLSAGLLSDRRDLFEVFSRRIRAGVVNWNRQLTNASSRMPFGGVGISGNHRPSGYFAAEYCSYPVAVMAVEHLNRPEKPTPGIPGTPGNPGSPGNPGNPGVPENPGLPTH